jgi:hypothetical protein
MGVNGARFNVAWETWDRFEDLDGEDMLTACVRVAVEDRPESVFGALVDVLVARFINRAAGETGIDRKRLCLAFGGHLEDAALDAGELARVLDAALVGDTAKVTAAVG